MRSSRSASQRLERRVAVKVLPPTIESDRLARARLRAEALAALADYRTLGMTLYGRHAEGALANAESAKLQQSSQRSLSQSGTVSFSRAGRIRAQRPGEGRCPRPYSNSRL